MLTLLGANCVAWGLAWLVFRDQPALLGLALLAWMFGIRHAVDIDHIVAIDNTVRKLMQDGDRPVTTGLWFALGHSTVVVLLCVVIAACGPAALACFPVILGIGGSTGMVISCLFLLAIGFINFVIMLGVWRSFRRARAAGRQAFQDAAASAGGGLMHRIAAPLFRSITRSWHMYPVGFLFGLGFDTATEIGLLSIAATQSAGGLSAWRALIFPALFTAGMALVDTADSALMVQTYETRFVSPWRKLCFNLTLTAASVLVAFLAGGAEALLLLAHHLGWQGWFWRGLERLASRSDLLGGAVAGVFVMCWLGAAFASRMQEQRAPLEPSEACLPRPHVVV